MLCYMLLFCFCRRRYRRITIVQSSKKNKKKQAFCSQIAKHSIFSESVMLSSVLSIFIIRQNKRCDSQSCLRVCVCVVDVYVEDYGYDRRRTTFCLLVCIWLVFFYRNHTNIDKFDHHLSENFTIFNS